MSHAMLELRAGLALLLLLCALGASAHTSLSGSSPADGAALQDSPEVLVLEFPMPVRLVKLTLSPVDGAAIDLGNYRTGGAATSFSVPLPVLAPASYRVEWTVMGGDSHKMSGTLGFTVGSD